MKRIDAKRHRKLHKTLQPIGRVIKNLHHVDISAAVRLLST